MTCRHCGRSITPKRTPISRIWFWTDGTGTYCDSPTTALHHDVDLSDVDGIMKYLETAPSPA